MKIIFSCVLIFLLCFNLIIFSACSQVNQQKLLYISDFNNGNNNVFVEYGSVTKNNNATITLYKSATESVGPISYFEEEDKNFEWTKNGFSISIEFKINEINENQGFTWSIGINDKNKKNIGNFNLDFRKHKESLQVGYSIGKSNNETNELATLNESSNSLLNNSWLKSVFKFYPDLNNIINTDLTLLDENNNELYSVKKIKLKNLTDYEISEEFIGGIGYCWLSWMSVSSLNLKEIKIFK